MGLTCSCEDVKAVVESEQLEERFAEVASRMEKLAKDAEQAAAEGVEVADDTKVAVADAAELLADAREEAAKLSAGDEKAGQALQALKGDVAKVVAAVEKLEHAAVLEEGEAAQVVADAKEIIAEATAVAAAATAAAVGDDTSPSVVALEFFDGKGASQSMSFPSRGLGFELAMSSPGCCSKAKARVVVKSLQKGGQAEKFGVKRSWALRSVNGQEVMGLVQAKELLSKGVEALPEQ